jgi:hypothetical protein
MEIKEEKDVNIFKFNYLNKFLAIVSRDCEDSRYRNKEGFVEMAKFLNVEIKKCVEKF